MRKLIAVSFAITTLLAGAAVDAAPAAPVLQPDGVYARPSYRAVVPDAQPGLLAGAAVGDISPPAGAPSTGFYVYRVCPAGTPLEAGATIDDWPQEVQQDPTEAPYAPSQCVASKIGPDTELYAKTFPASSGRFGRLEANAFVLQDGNGTKVALVSVDLPGFFSEMHQAVANRIADLGIPRENLLVSASHTHTGPGGYFQQNFGWAALGGDEYDPRIFETITAGIVAAIESADANLRPARMATGSANVDGLNGNRRGSQWELNPEAQLGIDPRNAPRIGMIRIDGADGRPIGAITNFSSHGTIGGLENMWHTGDDKQWVRYFVERGIGEGAVVASLNGAQGDIGNAASDTGGWRGGSGQWGDEPRTITGPIFGQFARMEGAGRRQAPHQIALWESLESELTDEVTFDARMDHICFCGQEVPDDPYDPFDRGSPWETPSDDPAYHNVATFGIVGSENNPLPTTVIPGQGRKRPLLPGPPPLSPKNLRIQLLRIGDVAFATMPGEPTITLGRRIERSVKAALNGGTPDALVEHVWTTGLANDHTGYMSTPQEYEGYQYEASWSMFGQQTGNEFKHRFVQLATWMALGRATPPCTETRNCAENPDLSALSLPPIPLVPDAGVAITKQPGDVERFQATSITWIGGSPSAEWNPGVPMATLQRNEAGDWIDVASDLDPVIPLRYDKRYGLHRYQALFDPTADTPTGTYRFVLTGRSTTVPGSATPYRMESEEFEITASSALALLEQPDGTFAVEHPMPAPRANFRWRPRLSSGWSLSGTLDGSPFGANAPFTFAGELVVPAGGIVDPWGNTNGAAVTIVR